MNIFKESFSLLKDILAARQMVWQLVRQDFRNRCIGATLGFVWTFIQQLVMIIIFWFVFSIAFKASTVDGIPFISWFIAGIAAWNFFSEALNLATNVFYEYSFLVKKVNFKIVVLPIVKIFSSLIIHGIFLLIVFIVLFLTHVQFSIYSFQVIYYTIALVIFLIGLSWITSSFCVFVKDVSYVVSILLQFGFWLTPIFWDIKMIPESLIPGKFLFLFKLNPVFYIVDGYRKSLIFQKPIFDDWQWSVYFWAVTFVILLLGILCFKKLKRQFADVL